VPKASIERTRESFFCPYRLIKRQHDFLPGLAEQKDAIGTAAVKADATGLIASKFVPEPKDGNAELVLRPDFNCTKNNWDICRIEPFEKQGVLLPISDARDKSPKVLENTKKNKLRYKEKSPVRSSATAMVK